MFTKILNFLSTYISNLNGNLNNYLALNLSTLYFSDKLIYIFITTVIVLFSTFVFKKEGIKSNRDNSKTMLLIILITSLVSLNPISLVLSGYIFFQLDTFGLYV